MQRRILAGTGISVSELALGTALGADRPPAGTRSDCD